jgi:hypothetical protein
MLYGRTKILGAMSLTCALLLSKDVCAQTRVTLSSLDLGPQAAIEKEISSDESSDYLRRLANAVTFIQAGSSADYSTPFRYMVLNVGVGLGYQDGYAGLDDVLQGKANPDRLGAFSAQAALSIGLHFADEQRSRFFASFASSDYSNHSLELENSGWGVLWQYDLVRAPERPSPLLSWNGLKVGTGFRWNRFRSHFSKHLSELSADVSVPGQGTLNASMAADLDVSGDVRVMSVPFEVGTALRWMSVLSLYGVLGADLNFGDARGSLLVKGPLSFSTTTANGESEQVKADAEYAVTKSEEPDMFSLRGLVGLQFELGRGSVFVQYQRSSLEDAEAAALGFRTYF